MKVATTALNSFQWLPAAAIVRHGAMLSWTSTTNPKGVLHTTESSSWPNYENWTILPHATILPTAGKGIEIHQHIPFTLASFALRHTDSQATNTDFAFQFEMIGTSESGGPGYYWPNADNAVLLDLYLKVIKPLDGAFIIPMKAATFKAFPASFGTNNGVRMSDAAWNVYTGWCGHEHVPQNDHGDPGLFPWAKLVAIAKEYEDMAATNINMDQEIRKLTAYEAQLMNQAFPPGSSKEGDSFTLKDALVWGTVGDYRMYHEIDQQAANLNNRLNSLNGQMVTLTAQVQTLTAQVQTLSAQLAAFIAAYTKGA
jgi:hypothetical protein